MIVSDPIKLNKEYLESAGETLGRAFFDYPVSNFIRPNPKIREKRLKYDLMLPVCIGLRYGEVYASSENLEGIAVWIPFEKYSEPFSWVIRCASLSMLHRTGFNTIKRALRVQKCISKAHKLYAPNKHLYLQILGVDPEFQGKGYGGILLAYKLRQIDIHERIPIYLETNKEKNVSFYEKFGFQLLNEVIIPKTNIRAWFMMRD